MGSGAIGNKNKQKYQKILIMFAYVSKKQYLRTSALLLFYVCANPPSGDLSGAALEVPSEALLHPRSYVRENNAKKVVYATKVVLNASLEDGIKDAYSLECRGGNPRRVTAFFGGVKVGLMGSGAAGVRCRV